MAEKFKAAKFGEYHLLFCF